MSNTEQTLSIIKPDAVERNLENEIKEMFKIKKNDTPQNLAKRILVEEHKLYPKAILKIFNL